MIRRWRLRRQLKRLQLRLALRIMGEWVAELRTGDL